MHSKFDQIIQSGFVPLIAIASVFLKFNYTSMVVIITGIAIISFWVKNFRSLSFTNKEVFFVISVLLYFIWNWVSLGWSENPILGTSKNVLLIPWLLSIFYFLPIKKTKGLPMKLYKGVFTLFSLICIVALFVDDHLTIANFIHFFIVEKVHFHQVYLGMFYLPLVAVTFGDFLKTKRVLLLLELALFMFTLLLLSSLMILFAGVACIFLVAFFHIKRSWIRLAIILGSVIIGLVGYTTNNSIRYKVDNVLHVQNDIPAVVSELNESFENKGIVNSSQTRVVKWTCAIENISERLLLGYGRGSEKEVQSACYEGLDFKYGYTYKYNTHNQYLEVWLGTGLIGLILFLAYLISLVNLSRDASNKAITIACIVICFVLLTEVLFDRQRGVHFFSFVPLFFIYLLKSKNEEGVSS